MRGRYGALNEPLNARTYAAISVRITLFETDLRGVRLELIANAKEMED